MTSMRDRFLRLLAYNTWANQHLAAALKEVQDLDEPERLMAHIVTAEAIFLQRMRERDPWPQQFWPDLGLAASAEAIQRNHADYTSFLRTLSEPQIEMLVAYRTSAGVRQASHLSDMLEHVFSHGAYHRGQINHLLRRFGKTPVKVGYIDYVREVPARS